MTGAWLAQAPAFRPGIASALTRVVFGQEIGVTRADPDADRPAMDRDEEVQRAWSLVFRAAEHDARVVYPESGDLLIGGRLVVLAQGLNHGFSSSG